MIILKVRLALNCEPNFSPVNVFKKLLHFLNHLLFILRGLLFHSVEINILTVS